MLKVLLIALCAYTVYGVFVFFSVYGGTLSEHRREFRKGC